MSEPDRRYWFPAKRYGWGWGPPRTWEGWVVLVGWFVAFVVGQVRLAPSLLPTHPGLFALFVGAMVAVLLAICFAKGEPPRWRWGWGDRNKPPGA